MAFERIFDFCRSFRIFTNLFFTHDFQIFPYTKWILMFSSPIGFKNWHDIQTTTDAKDILIDSHMIDLFPYFPMDVFWYPIVFF